MSDRVLLVDDDKNILAAIRRQLGKRHQIETASSALEAIEMMSANGTFAVVVSDMQMPGLNGIQFLSKIREAFPNTVRMMLTGNSDQKTAMDAVNDGAIFRFLVKPCSTFDLERVIQAGIQQHRLIVVEKDVLEKTLSGSLALITEVLSMFDPRMFGHATKTRDLVHQLAGSLKIKNYWEVEAASMFSQIGFISVPPDILIKFNRGEKLKAVEERLIEKVPEVSTQLLEKIPRLKNVSKIVLYKNKNFDGSGFPHDEVKGKVIPLGARILRVISDLAKLEEGGARRAPAFQIMKNSEGVYDREVLTQINKGLQSFERSAEEKGEVPTLVLLGDLREGCVLLQDLEAEDGTVLLSSGQRISEPVRERIKNYSEYMKIKEPIRVKFSPIPECKDVEIGI